MAPPVGATTEPGEFLRPRALAIDDQDRIYVADSCNHRIQVFDTQGKLLNAWGTRGTAPGQMSYPYDLAIGPDGALYVCEYGNQRVQKFAADGAAGSLGGWGAARVNCSTPGPWPSTVRGAVSVIDTNNHRVQRFRL